MTTELKVERGVRALRRHLKTRLFDLRRADFVSFKSWLTNQIPYWQRSATFDARCKIRELRRANPNLIDLERETAKHLKAFEASPAFAQTESLKKSIYDANKAIEGLTKARDNASSDKRDALNEKLADFETRRTQSENDLASLATKHAEKADYDTSVAQLEKLKDKLGVTQAEQHLREVQHQRGRSSGKSGTSFEETSRQVVEQHIVSDFIRATTSEESRSRIRILSSVTLGAARAEIDQMVVRLPRGQSLVVEVLAMVEAKRNINDLDIGFRHRQSNLAWFTGDQDAYDSESYRTAKYPTGHFEGTATHEENGDEYQFNISSFRHFRREPLSGHFLDRLYFITTPGRLFGMSSDEMSRLQHRCCTDFEFDLKNDAYLNDLWKWARELPSEFEGPDVFETYTSSPKWGRNLLLVS